MSRADLPMNRSNRPSAMIETPPYPAFHYRPDIDGLRAVAVLSVLACHMEIRRMAGGFVGVDVFFVISGYLISSIVFSDIARSRFSIRTFYERRIRRIFPALFVMLLAYSIFAALYFLPSELAGFGKALLAATLSVSNFYLWQHSGYFDSPNSNPLLHTWSLAVEEQFYVVFPIFLVLVRKFFPRSLKFAVATLFFLSLLASQIVVAHSRNTAFFMPWTRAWELLLGTLLSLKVFPPHTHPWSRNLGTVLGASMIAFAVLTFSSATSFPGFSALLPCVGSALIIAAGESGPSIVGAALSSRPVVFVGLLSYSLYLWHWPVIILHRMGVLLGQNSTLPRNLALRISTRHYDIAVELLASLVLAAVTWRFVERPFRAGPLKLSGSPLFSCATAVLALFTFASICTILGNGFPQRFSPESVRLASYLDRKDAANSDRLGTCFLTSTDSVTDYNQNLCLHQDTAKDNDLLLGDSHSAMLWAGLSSALPEANIMQASVSGCEPLVHPVGGPACRQMMNFIYGNYLQHHPVHALLLQARWTPSELGRLADTLAWARTHHVPVILFGPVPEYDAPLPRLEAYAVAWRQFGLAARHRLVENQHLDEQMLALASALNVPYVSLYRAICPAGECTEYSDAAQSVPLMFDTNHLSPAGSSLIVHRLLERGDLRCMQPSELLTARPKPSHPVAPASS